MKIIESLDELKKLASSGEGLDCYIRLTGGLRSSKFITFDGKDSWYVFNGIDGSEQTLSTEDLATTTNIIDAIEKRALIEY